MMGLGLRKLRQIIMTISVVCAFIILFRFISSYFPHSRLWGFNHLAYFSLPVGIFITVIGILVCLPRIGRLFVKTMDRFERLSIPFNQNGLYLFTSIFSFFFFWNFRSSTPLLGDGTLWIKTLSQGGKFDPILTTKEPLTLFIHFYLFRHLNDIFGWNAEKIFAVVSCLSGAVFILLLLKYLDFLKIRSLSKWLFFIIIVFMGSSQLLFGYIEDYTLYYVAVFAYIFLGMRYLSGQGSVLLPLSLFLLSIGFHYQAMILIPSLVFLFLFSLDKGKKNILMSLTFKNVSVGILISLLIMSGIYFMKGFHINGEIFMPMTHSLEGTNLYTLFSLKHLLDLLNQQFLISSQGIILLSVLMIFFWREIDWNDPKLSFLVLVGFYFLLFNFIIYPDLGMARDWDLFAASGIGYTLLAIFLVAKLVDGKRFMESIGVILAGTALVSSIPWFLVNSSEGRSVDRFENLLVVDRDRSAYGYEILSIFYREQEMENESIDALKNAIEVSPEIPRYYFNLGNLYQEKKLFPKAITQYLQAIRIKPDYAEAHMNLGNVFTMQRRYDEAIKAYKNAIEFSPGFPAAHFNIANAYYYLGQYDLAQNHLTIAENLGLKIDPNFIEELKQLLKE
jgi:tetratricopeptide (TPR) repeat protein